MWWECQTCGQKFTGAMRTGLAEAWWSRVCDKAEESAERLFAAGNLAECRRHDREYGEAERTTQCIGPTIALCNNNMATD